MTTTDAHDRKLAHEADKSASDAKYDAKLAGKADSGLDDFQKDVVKLKSKITGDKTKLSSFSGNNHNNLPYNQFARKQTMRYIIPWWGINAPLWQSLFLHSIK